MNKKFLISLVALVLVVGFGVFLSLTGKEPSQTETESYTESESLVIARDWVKNEAPTYIYDGSDLESKNSTALPDCEDCYEFSFSFQSSHGGFGDRKEQVVTQAITPHLIKVQVKNGEVIQAITDNSFNEMTGEMISQNEPGSKPQEVELYYYNQNEDKDEDGKVLCSPDAVQPISRTIPPTQKPIPEALELLLRGEITSQEKEQGFSTEFPEPGFELEDWQLENGLLTLTFTEITGFTSGGSCRITLLRSQIEKTALQFSDVEEVIIKPDSIFQP